VKRHRLQWAGALAVMLLLVTACDSGSFKQEDNPQNLKALFEQIHQTVHVKNDAKQATALFQSMIPDEGRLKKALKDGVAADAVGQIGAFHKSMPITEDAVRKLARSNQSEVQVHGAKTEEIVAYQPGSVAHKEFPGGTRRVASELLRPGLTFYEVEYLEPGKDAGMKYHLIYWDGKRWSMLGPVWRVLK
jgi:hypothetical protein